MSKRIVLSTNIDALEIIKKDEGADYVVSWKSVEVFNSKLKALFTAFLYSIKHS